jgi:hypothetical protein
MVRENLETMLVEARRFYERCGFVPLAAHPLSLIILTKTTLAAVPPPGSL